jgi:hypothetical protein
MSQSNNENLPEPIAPMRENLSFESLSRQSQDSETLENTENREEIDRLSPQDSDSSDVTSEDVTTEDQDWETVHLPNSINVDELEVAEDLPNPDLEELEPNQPRVPDAELEESYPLPLDYEMTIAQHQAAQELVDMAEAESSMTKDELGERIEYLEALLENYQQSLNEQQLSARSQQKEIDEKIQQLQVAQNQIQDLSQALEACQEEMRAAQRAIAVLSENWQQSQERFAQLERECATTQQRYNQQVQLNLQAANTCRELRSRLHRQQRQALQFKAALEKSLTHKSLMNPDLEEVIAKDHSSPLNLPDDFSSDPSVEETKDPASVSPGQVVPNSAPIEPWSTNSDLSLSDFGEKSDPKPRQTDTTDSESLSARSKEPIDLLKSEASGDLSMGHSPEETFWPEDNNLIQTIRDMVSAEGVKAEGVKGASESRPQNSQDSQDSGEKTEDNSGDLNSLANREQDATVLPEREQTKSDTEPGSSLEFSSDILEIPEITDPINTEPAESEKTWPAPVVYPERSIKKRRSLASVELPSFPTKE